MPEFSYLSKNFVDYRVDLINYLTQYYGTSFANSFNDAAVGSALIDLAAGVGDELSFHVDKRFTETQINYAQERKSFLNMARTLGVKVPNIVGSVSLVDFTATVPVNGSSFDVNYCPIITAGAQVVGGGKTFETENDIIFSSPFNSSGTPNRIVIPTINSNGEIENYKITKRELVINGKSAILKRTITSSDVTPFMEVYLSEQNVIKVESIFILDGTSFKNVPDLTQYKNTDSEWYEVDSLAQQQVYVEDNTFINTESTSSASSVIKKGKWVDVNRKFITEFTDANYLKIVFGSATSVDSDNSSLTGNTYSLISNFIDNISLGLIPQANKTMFVTYRIGDLDSNIGVGALTTLNNATITLNGSNVTKNTQVKASIKVSNPIPAVGGKNGLSIDELKYLIKYNNAAQDRCVTIQDYRSRISKMNGKYGAPFRYGIAEVSNKVQITMLSLDDVGNLSSNIPSPLMDNLASYLSNYRMINDYVEVYPGKIINLGWEIDVLVDNSFSKSMVINNVINVVKTYTDINKRQMGENLYLGQLRTSISNVSGVIHVIDLRCYNKVNGNYSPTYISQSISDTSTMQINLTDDILYSEPDSCFETKYPMTDIRVRVKNN